MAEKPRITINIGTVTLVKIFGVIAAMVLLYFVRDVLFLLFVVLAIVVALDPLVDNIQKYLRFPRWLAVSSLYVVVIAIIALVIGLIIPPLVEQVKTLSENLPVYINKLMPAYQNIKDMIESSKIIPSSQSILNQITSSLSGFSNSILSTTMDVFGGFISLITILVLTFYMLLEESASKKALMTVIPTKNREYVIKVLNRIGDRVGGWARGQLLLMLAIFITTLIGLLILRVPYALTLALIAGLTEVIPVIGPWIGAVPAVLVAFTVSPILGVLTIVLYILVQQLENHILVPNVMRRTVGLSPVLVIIGMLTGAKLMGLLGILIAVPIVAIIVVIIQEIFNSEGSVRNPKAEKEK